MQKKISIIIPIYNGEKYISRCVDSVLRQTGFNPADLEVILINDGSKDGSLTVIRDYEKRYPAIVRVVDQENSGVAKTRNKGIDLAKAKYMMFIDQDDFIDADYCNKFYNAAESGGCDIVMGGFKRPGAGGRLINKYVKLKSGPYAKYVCMALYAKIHKTSFVRANKIRVFPTAYGEDVVFMLNEYSKTNKIKVIDDYVGYNWFYNNESVSNTSQKKIMDMLSPLIVLLNKAKELDVKGGAEHEYFVLQTVVFYFLWTGRAARVEDFKQVYRRVFAWLADNYPNFASNKYVLFGPSGAPLLNRFSIGAFMLIHKFHLMALFAKMYCRGKQ